MTPDEQEALSRLYSDDVIRLLPLKSGAVAVFNNARDLCGIIPAPDGQLYGNRDTPLFEIVRTWYPPKRAPAPDLKELGLI